MPIHFSIGFVAESGARPRPSHVYARLSDKVDEVAVVNRVSSVSAVMVRNVSVVARLDG